MYLDPKPNVHGALQLSEPLEGTRFGSERVT